jgi:hypothetical protein
MVMVQNSQTIAQRRNVESVRVVQAMSRTIALLVDVVIRYLHWPPIEVCHNKLRA